MANIILHEGIHLGFKILWQMAEQKPGMLIPHVQWNIEGKVEAHCSANGPAND